MPSPLKHKGKRRGIGMPTTIYFGEFGQVIWDVFGSPPYWVGSSLTKKTWRDVDVRLILSDEEYKKKGFGKPDDCHQNAKWVGLVKAFSILGKEMTGLPIDFQIQQQSDANKKYPNPRSALFDLKK